MRAKRNERWFEYMAGKRDYSTVYLDRSKLPPGVYLDPCPSSRDRVASEMYTQ